MPWCCWPCPRPSQPHGQQSLSHGIKNRRTVVDHLDLKVVQVEPPRTGEYWHFPELDVIGDVVRVPDLPHTAAAGGEQRRLTWCRCHCRRHTRQSWRTLAAQRLSQARSNSTQPVGASLAETEHIAARQAEKRAIHTIAVRILSSKACLRLPRQRGSRCRGRQADPLGSCTPLLRLRGPKVTAERGTANTSAL